MKKHQTVKTDERNIHVPNIVFDTYYEDYIEFKHYINDVINSFKTSNMKHSESKLFKFKISKVKFKEFHFCSR